MAKLTHQSNFNSVSLGQFGSAHLDTTAQDLTCPAGKSFVAITMLEDTTFTKLEATVSIQEVGSFGTDGNGDADYDGKGDYVTTSTIFPKGLTIYGDWDKINLASGKILAYWGPSA